MNTGGATIEVNYVCQHGWGFHLKRVIRVNRYGRRYNVIASIDICGVALHCVFILLQGYRLGSLQKLLEHIFVCICPFLISYCHISCILVSQHVYSSIEEYMSTSNRVATLVLPGVFILVLAFECQKVLYCIVLYCLPSSGLEETTRRVFVVQCQNTYRVLEHLYSSVVIQPFCSVATFAFLCPILCFCGFSCVILVLYSIVSYFIQFQTISLQHLPQVVKQCLFVLKEKKQQHSSGSEPSTIALVVQHTNY